MDETYWALLLRQYWGVLHSHALTWLKFQWTTPHLGCFNIWATNGEATVSRLDLNLDGLDWFSATRKASSVWLTYQQLHPLWSSTSCIWSARVLCSLATAKQPTRPPTNGYDTNAPCFNPSDFNPPPAIVELQLQDLPKWLLRPGTKKHLEQLQPKPPKHLSQLRTKAETSQERAKTRTNKLSGTILAHRYAIFPTKFGSSQEKKNINLRSFCLLNAVRFTACHKRDCGHACALYPAGRP